MPSEKRRSKTKHRKSRFITTSKKTSKHKKHTLARQINGGGFMDLIIREEKDKSTLPFGLSRYDPSRYFQSTRVNTNMLRALYNYGTPYQIDLTLKQNQLIPSSQVINKPHIFLPDMNNYLIALVEHPGTPNARLLWLASYKNRSWEHDILTYSPPSPKQGQIRTYTLLIYKYPLDFASANLYKPIETTTAKRKEEYRNFEIYLSTNKMIQPLPGLAKNFRVVYDSGNALSFLSNVLIGKSKSGSIGSRQNKSALRIQYREPQMKRIDKMQKIK